jgi:serine phosphatase RsbU (regulator of sigma subunit)
LAAIATGKQRWPQRLTVIVLATGLVVTATLAWTTWELHQSNEDRLLRQRVREAASVITTALPSIQTPLASAAELADATDGNEKRFARLIDRYLLDDDPKDGNEPFVGASIWQVNDGDPRVVASVGAPPAIEGSAARVDAFFTRAHGTADLHVIGLLTGEQPRLGYGFTPVGRTSDYVAYAEAALPPNRTAVIREDNAFADLDYAIYLGDTEHRADLLVASTSDLPIDGRRAAENAAFGDTQLRLVMTPRRVISGTFSERLPWIVVALGTVLAIGATLMTERLVRRRRRAEELAERLNEIADENQRLYGEQRSIAETLQHALLPGQLPEVAGVDIAARYLPGVEGVEIGGDWYDVMHIDERRVLFAVGDVSGRGLRAATIMAALRYAIRAYAAQGDNPSTLLAKLSHLVNVSRDGHFATVLCGVLDLDTREVTLASAGHPSPLLIDGDRAEFVTTTNGVPIGVANGAPYESTTFSVPTNGTLLAFTDGLVERRREDLGVGLERLQGAVSRTNGSLDDLLTTVLHELTPEGSDDDTAILGLRWRS